VVAQEIVSDHGGQIDVASELGQGTAFSVRLPNGRATPPDEPLAR
jgi:signal transduction histidine kinase